MTAYVFHYDLEDPDLCIEAAPRLVALHVHYGVPGYLLHTRNDA
jgi:hypothetical protein